MNENCELLNNIFKSSEMAKYTLEVLLSQIKNKDNNIKPSIKDILIEYDKYIKKVKGMLKERGYKLERQTAMKKMMAKMGIKKEVCCDNSDSSISKMIIQGITMGILEVEQLISKKEEIDAKELQIAKDFTEFQKDSVDKLKEYL